MPSPAPSHQTRPTMFERLRDLGDVEAWRSFQDTYFDLLVRYARRAGLSHVDAEDLAQGVLAAFVRVIPSFRYDQAKGRFRSYLGRCMSHAIARWKKSPGAVSCALDELESRTTDAPSPNGHAEEEAWEREWVAFHYRRALHAVRQHCHAQSMDVLEASARGLSTSQIAATHGMSEDAVYKALQRMRARLCEQIAAQIKEEDDGGV